MIVFISFLILEPRVALLFLVESWVLCGLTNEKLRF